MYEYQKWASSLASTLTLKPTESFTDLITKVKEINLNTTIPVFMGGDGTLSESINVLFQKYNFKIIPYTVGFLPAGSGNSFLKDFELTEYKNAVEDLIESVKSKSFAEIDAGIIEYHQNEKDISAKKINPVKKAMINIWGIGIVSSIAELAMKIRFLGKWNYTAATLIRTFSHKPYSCNVYIDKEEKTEKYDFITVSNSRYTGGDMLMAPPVRLNDGMLFLVQSKTFKPLKILAIFPKIFKGDHINTREVRSHFVKAIEFNSNKPFLMLIDGELQTGWNPKISMQKKSWKLFVTEKSKKNAGLI